MLVATAAENDSSISLDELLDLLPPDRFQSQEELGQFIDADDRLSAVAGEVTPRGRESLAAGRERQRALAELRLAEADHFLSRLGGICPWLELAGVSGSTAYRGAKPTDDIDFFLVTRDHRLWITLFLAFARARIERLRSQDAPVYCFNRLVDRSACARTFRERRDPLFAREALNLRLLRGGALYARFLDSAPWMAEPFPSLYASRRAAVHGRGDEAAHADWAGGRVLNAAALLLLGPYLWLAGLVRNARLRQAGRHRECFRTIVRPEFYATESVLFDELRDQYERVFA